MNQFVNNFDFTTPIKNKPLPLFSELFQSLFNVDYIKFRTDNE